MDWEPSHLALLGSFGLHTVCDLKKWNLKKLLSIMRVHQNVHITRITNSLNYRLQFCSEGWIEHKKVAKGARNVYPKIVTIVEYWICKG